MNAPAPAKIVVTGTVEIAPEHRDRFLELVRNNVADAIGVDGLLYYHFAIDVVNPNIIRNVEAWTDRASLDAHLQGPLMQAVFAEVGKLRIVSRHVDIHTVEHTATL
jgi:quinol monooxygenase YgiN